MLEDPNIRENWLKNPAYVHIRRTIVAKILNYAEHGHPVGDFLTVVLCNDLREAVMRADDDNLRELKAIVLFCHNEIPGNCWGSTDHVQAHLLRHEMAREAHHA